MFYGHICVMVGQKNQKKGIAVCRLSLICLTPQRLPKNCGSMDDPPDYKLRTLMEYLEIEQVDAHRGVGDCSATKLLYDKLRAISSGDVDEKVNENGGVS